MNDYKKFHLILTVSPQADGCGGIVSLSIEYEKVNEDSRAPVAYLALCQKIIESMNSYLWSSE